MPPGLFLSAFPYYLHVTPAEDRFLGMPPGPGGLVPLPRFPGRRSFSCHAGGGIGGGCLFHVALAEDRFLVMPPAGPFPPEERGESPPGLRPRAPLSRAAVGFRSAANLHPTAASVRPCARCGCLPRLISSQSPIASAIAWCPLIAATGCCARFRTALPWQRFLPGTPAEQNQLPQQRGPGYCMAARAALSQYAPQRRWLSGPCKEISRGRGLQRAESSTEARWAEGLQTRQRGTAAGQNGVRGRSPGGLW